MRKPKSLAEKRQIDNEVVFRKANVKVQHELEKLKEMAASENRNDILPSDKLPIHFYCECSDENCKQRIALSLAKYEELHSNKQRFIVKPGHETPNIEKTVSKKPNYNVVDKFISFKETATKLKSTTISNV